MVRREREIAMLADRGDISRIASDKYMTRASTVPASAWDRMVERRMASGRRGYAENTPPPDEDEFPYVR